MRRAMVMVSIASAALALWPACSPPTRYRVLSFFFDGVPAPGTTPQRGYPTPLAPALGTGEVAGGASAGRPVQPHPPYRENRCRACHDFTSGALLRTAGEGLCETCHKNVPRESRYVHGPVAVRDCLVCHHYHGSPHPHLLLAEPDTVCLNCHERDRLITCEGRTVVEGQTCLECHTGHGGDNPFFLKRR